MKTNTLLFDILRSKWLIKTDNIAEYEKLANRFLQGEYKGETFDRPAFKAAYETPVASPANRAVQKTVGYLPMRGAMVTYGDYCMLGADDYLEALRFMNESEKISAIVLDIDGPGGAVSAINAFIDFKAEKKKPIVVLANDLCSLHYWLAALLGDHVMANGSISPCIGSIGVMFMLVDAREAMKKEGYSVMMINADGSEMKNKAMLDFYAGKDEEFIARLRAEMKPVRDAFLADVKAGMTDLSDDPRIFAGDTFSATEALDLGMIHSIGNLAKAMELAEALAELNEN